MLLLYIYDIKAKDKRSFNRTKRLFYYHLGRLPIDRELWKSKSAIAVRPGMEKMMDAHFKRFGSDVEVYKVAAESIELLE